MKLEFFKEYIENKKNIALVGAGGKTTLMYYLARELSLAGKKVVVTTTTHIVKPDTCYAGDENEVEKLWNQGNYAVIGEEKKTEESTGNFDITNRNKTIKLTSAPKSLYESVSKKADIILSEADGSKQMPCKVPASHEPVIPEKCDLIIAVIGMKAFGNPIGDVCFRFEEEGSWLEVERDYIFDEKIAARILSSEKGSKKLVNGREYLAVLNQCNDDKMKECAKRISELLKEEGIKSVIVGRDIMKVKIKVKR